MAWSWGFIGVWGPVTTYTAEMYPTRIRGVGNGFSWAMAFIVGAVLWLFVAVYLRETTGSFVAAFLLIPVILLVMAAIISFYSRSMPARRSTRSASDLGFADRELLRGMHLASPTGLALPSPQETRLAAIGPQG